MPTMSIMKNSNEAGRLRLGEWAAGLMGRSGASVIDITSHATPERQRVEIFIRNVYRQSYQADISVEYPTLMSIRTKDGEILGALGFRCAEGANLFLERYVGAPVERHLSETYSRHIERRDIVEIGNLASTGSGVSVYLFAALASYLHVRDIQYAVITGTAPLQQRFCKLGLNPHVICKADPQLLSEAERMRWGSYYDQQPHVLSGFMPDAVCHLEKALGIFYEEQPGLKLFPRLHYGQNT